MPAPTTVIDPSHSQERNTDRDRSGKTSPPTMERLGRGVALRCCAGPVLATRTYRVSTMPSIALRVTEVTA